MYRQGRRILRGIMYLPLCVLVTLLLSPIHKFTASGNLSVEVNSQTNSSLTLKGIHRMLHCTKEFHSERPILMAQTPKRRERGHLQKNCWNIYSRSAIEGSVLLDFHQPFLNICVCKQFPLQRFDKR